MQVRNGWGIAVFVTAIAGTAHAGHEVHVYGIGKFGGDGECGSSDQTHNVHTSTAAAFRAPFEFLTSMGQWDDYATNHNKNAKRTLWKDASKTNQFGIAAQDTVDDRGVDDADVLYVHTHGGRSVSGNYSSLSMGSSTGGGCAARTDQDMLFNSDLEIAVIKACQSGDYEVWQQGGYWSLVNSSSSFTMWNAFHGDSSCGSHVTDYVSEYAWSSIEDGVGENWLDLAYDSSGDDDCPVSIVFGDTKSKRRHMYEYGGFLDRENTGTKNASTIFYIGGCNPDHGIKLPD